MGLAFFFLTSQGAMMESDIKIQTPNWRGHLTLGLFGAVVIIGLGLMFPGPVGLILFSIAGVVIMMGLLWAASQAARLYYAVRMSQQALRLETYKADRAEAERFVLSFNRTERILLPDGANVRLIEAMADSAAAALAGEVGGFDLATVFMQPLQVYAIIGAQQTGKTFQARHLAALWIERGMVPLVIGPKWDRGEWGGCELRGGRGDYGAVEAGIEAVRREALRRHGDDSRGHKEHALKPVFFDDWTAIVEGCESSRALIFEAATLFASVNIVLYFIIHADTSAAWGVDRKGAALKDGFVKLFILPEYDQAGNVLRYKTRGLVRLPSGEERPAALFAGSLPAQGAALVIEAEAQGPSAEEQAVLDLWAGGERSMREITTQVWGKHGTFYNQKVVQILRKAELLYEDLVGGSPAGR